MNLFLAPIHGMTTAHYRNSYHSIFGGMDSYYAPFIGATIMRKSNSSIFNDILPKYNDPSVSVVPQILGNNGTDFHYFATRIAAIGYEEINWNIGCPFHKVTRKIKGSGLLPYPDRIKAFLDEVCSQKSYDLTIKMRLGLQNVDEGYKVMELLNDYPLKGVILHARTGAQLYSGVVDLEAFETLYKVSKHKLTYNGDIYSLSDYKTIQARFPDIDSFMIGRGALRNPFLASEIKGITYDDSMKLIKLREFHDTMFNYTNKTLPNEHRSLNNMKEFWDYLSHFFDTSEILIKQIQACQTIDSYEQLISRVLPIIQ